MNTHTAPAPSALIAGETPIQTYGKGRLCRCGARLSRYNPQRECGPCARTTTLLGGVVKDASPQRRDA